MKRFFLCIAMFLYINSIDVCAIDISAECACLINADTNEVVFEYNTHNRHSMASTTKIMTAIMALEKSNPDEIVTVSANASSQEGSSIYLKTGEEISMENLMYGMMLNSGNDAAYAIAEHIGGTNENFCQMMNEKAKEIGADNTSFKNSNGLDADGHYSTAYDMAIIASYGLKNDKFREIVSTKNEKIDNGDSITYLKNHNKLLWNYDGCIGVKTGYTKKTGRCLVSAAERDGVRLVAVTLNAPNDWEDHSKMLDYGFENIKKHMIMKKGDILKSINDELNAVLTDDIYITSKNNDKSKVNVVVHTIQNPRYNIYKSEKIGYAQIFYNNIILKEVDLVADADYTAKVNNKYSFTEQFIKIIKILLLNYQK